MSSLYARGNAILPFTPATNFEGKEGYGVTLAGDTATLGASATVVNRGIILDGTDTDKQSSIGIISALPAPVRVKLGGSVTRGDMLVQKNDGTWITDPAAGARVQSFMANEDGVAGDLIEAVPQTPTTLA